VYSETGDGLGNCGPLAYMAHLGAGYVTCIDWIDPKFYSLHRYETCGCVSDTWASHGEIKQM
jgi:hypothetical protein